jgi:hypothetical protein
MFSVQLSVTIGSLSSANLKIAKRFNSFYNSLIIKTLRPLRKKLRGRLNFWRSHILRDFFPAKFSLADFAEPFWSMTE